jgi:hypothetical protein
MKIIDDFIPTPRGEREYALDLPYEDVESQGVIYKNMCVIPGEKSNYALWHLIQQHHVPMLSPRLEFYRINKGSEESSTFIHSDKFFAEWIAIHYLNLPYQCNGGTSLWKHRSLELLEPPDDVTSVEAKLLNEDGLDQQLWQQVAFTPMVFNRLVIFKAALFHSRWPKDLSGIFGDDPETARLCHVFFYNLR